MAKRPPDAVDTRLLAAEATASAALALIQHPAVWEALTCLALITETIDARRHEGMDMVGVAVCDVVDGITLSEDDAERAVQLLNVVDHASRTWAGIAHAPHASPPPAPPWPAPRVV